MNYDIIEDVMPMVSDNVPAELFSQSDFAILVKEFSLKNLENISVIDKPDEIIVHDVVTIKPVFVYFRDDLTIEFVSSHLAQFNESAPWDLHFASCWSGLGDILKLSPQALVIHSTMLTSTSSTLHEMISMVETLVKLILPNKVLPIAVSIDKDTTLATVKDFQKAGVFGITLDPVTWGQEEALRSANALFNRIPYWPKHILEQLPGAVKKVTKDTISLTPRQSQIVTLISERGLSNKRIAQSLNITESTVKIHVSAILKAYGVRTRTQLAVVANK